MRKTLILALLGLTIGLGVIGLLAYTSESLHSVPVPTRPGAGSAHARAGSGLAEREIGPIDHRSGLMLTH